MPDEPHPKRYRRVEPARAEILERTKKDIAARLERICADMDRAAFEALVTQIAETEIRWRMRRPTNWKDPDAHDR